MATIEQSGGESLSLHPAIKLPHIPCTQNQAISIFWLALNFHWTARSWYYHSSQPGFQGDRTRKPRHGWFTQVVSNNGKCLLP